jgi:heme/copper-type cytochrome/quinol oxidase subunit 3
MATFFICTLLLVMILLVCSFAGLKVYEYYLEVQNKKFNLTNVQFNKRIQK